MTNSFFRSQQRQVIEALKAGDLEFIKKHTPPASHPDVYEITLHKLRVEYQQLPREMRLASALWLRDRGYSRIYGGDPVAAIEAEAAK